MKSGIYWALLIAVLFSIVAAPSLSVATPPTRINESFVLGTTGCQMNLTLQNDAVIAANIGQAFELPLVEIGTDETWRAIGASASSESPPPGAGWNTNVAFPNAWGSAKLQVMDQTLCNSGACIWATNNKFDAIIYAWFRKTFDITGNIISATLAGSADDYAQVYVNGTLVYTDPSPTFANDFGPIPIAPSLLHAGTNLIAAYAKDNPSPPYEHSFRAKLAIVTSAPSPDPLSPPPSCSSTGDLPIENITDTLICDDDGSGQPVLSTCKPKTAVERNIMEKSGDGSTYCYYTKTGSRVCKTL